MTEVIRIILASQSENRKRLLSSLNIAFTVVSSDIDEEKIHAETLRDRVRAIACAKARRVADREQGLIIAADTFSVYGGQQYQKPKTRNEAEVMLRQFSGQVGRVLTGVCVINTHEGREVSDVNELLLQCKVLSEDEIAEYVATRPVTEWAAVYNPLDPVSASIFRPIGRKKYKREYYGIGIETLLGELRRAGIPIDLSAAKESSDEAAL